MSNKNRSCKKELVQSGTDGWIDALRFKSFSTVFQSYQDDGWVIMKGCVQWKWLHLKREGEGARTRDRGPRTRDH